MVVPSPKSTPGLRICEDDLARTAPFTLFGGEVSVQTLVEQAVINHTEQHLTSLQAAVGPEARTSDNG
jgi:hypothetical protein